MAEEKPKGIADPLSGSTRALKKNLLLVSLLAITFKAFDVSIEKIPVGGVIITFDKGVFSFLLLCVLAYLIITFAIYYFIDIRNADPTPHQSQTEKTFRERANQFPYIYEGEIHKSIKDALPSDTHVVLTVAKALFKLKTESNPQLRTALTNREYFESLYRLIDTSKQNQTRDAIDYDRTEHKQMYDTANQIIKKYWHWYTWRRRLFQLSLLPRVWTIRIIYKFRNYGLDGYFPLILGATAFAAMTGIVDLRWIPPLVPTQ